MYRPVSNLSNPLKYKRRSILGNKRIIDRKERATRNAAVIRPVAILYKSMT